MNALMPWASAFALGCFLLGMACAAIRLVRGPTAQDRIVALDAMYTQAMLVMLLLGIRYGPPLYFDIALLIGLLGFAGSAAMAKFLLRGEVIEP